MDNRSLPPLNNGRQTGLTSWTSAQSANGFNQAYVQSQQPKQTWRNSLTSFMSLGSRPNQQIPAQSQPQGAVSWRQSFGSMFSRPVQYENPYGSAKDPRISAMTGPGSVYTQNSYAATAYPAKVQYVEKEEGCLSRNSHVVICCVFCLVVMGIVTFFLFFREPGFEADLDNLEIESFDVNFFSVDILATFPLIFTNDNFLDVDIQEVNAYVLAGSLEIAIALDQPAFLPAQAESQALATLAIEGGIDDLGEVFTIATSCLGGDPLVGELNGEAVGTYLGITQPQTLDPAEILIECPIRFATKIAERLDEMNRLEEISEKVQVDLKRTFLS